MGRVRYPIRGGDRVGFVKSFPYRLNSLFSIPLSFSSVSFFPVLRCAYRRTCLLPFRFPPLAFCYESHEFLFSSRPELCVFLALNSFISFSILDFGIWIRSLAFLLDKQDPELMAGVQLQD
jgi:hypothetical protein